MAMNAVFWSLLYVRLLLNSTLLLLHPFLTPTLPLHYPTPTLPPLCFGGLTLPDPTSGVNRLPKFRYTDTEPIPIRYSVLYTKSIWYFVGIMKINYCHKIFESIFDKPSELKFDFAKWHWMKKNGNHDTFLPNAWCPNKWANTSTVISNTSVYQC